MNKTVKLTIFSVTIITIMLVGIFIYTYFFYINGGNEGVNYFPDLLIEQIPDSNTHIFFTEDLYVIESNTIITFGIKNLAEKSRNLSISISNDEDIEIHYDKSQYEYLPEEGRLAKIKIYVRNYSKEFYPISVKLLSENNTIAEKTIQIKVKE